MGLRIRELVGFIEKSADAGYAQETGKSQTTAGLGYTQTLLDKKFVSPVWLMAPPKHGTSGTRKKVFAGIGAPGADARGYKDLPADLDVGRDRVSGDNFLTPTRKLPVGSGNVQYDPSNPANSSNPSNIISQAPSGATFVKFGSGLVKGLPLKFNISGGLSLSQSSGNSFFTGITYLVVTIGKKMFRSIKTIQSTPAAGAQVRSRLELSNLLADEFEVDSNVFLDNTEGTQVKVDLSVALNTLNTNANTNTAIFALLKKVGNGAALESGDFAATNASTAAALGIDSSGTGNLDFAFSNTRVNLFQVDDDADPLKK